MVKQETKIEKEHHKNREKYLEDLGFSSYNEYLASDYWLDIRAAVLDFDDRCYHCGKVATCVHHNSYRPEVLCGEDLSELYPLCKTCHYKLEFDKTGRKKSLGQVRLCCKQRHNKFCRKKSKRASVRPPNEFKPKIDSEHPHGP